VVDLQKKGFTRFLSTFIVFIFVFSSFAFQTSAASVNKVTYLALGDSLAAGQTPDKQLGEGFSDFIAGYFTQQQLLESYSNDFAVSGYTTGQVLADIESNKEVNGVKLQDAIAGANLITVTAGANDILGIARTFLENPAAGIDMQAVQAALVGINGNLSSIIDEIKAVNPHAEVYVSGYYFPFPHLTAEQQASLAAFLPALNGTIQKAAYDNGAYFVALEGVFGDTPTDYLTATDIHPTVEGYKLMAEAFIEAFTSSKEFADVPTDFWAYKAIKLLTTNKVMSGKTTVTFDPNGSITRAEVAQILVSAVPMDKSMPANPGFADVSETDPYYYAVAKLTQLGVFDDEAENFNPTKALTRGEMAKVLTLFFRLEATTTSSFKDIKADHWSKGFVDALVSNGITKGYSDNTFRQEKDTTRAEFAVFLLRAGERLLVVQD
jgi:lysophospholipase L1-like esterase